MGELISMAIPIVKLHLNLRPRSKELVLSAVERQKVSDTCVTGIQSLAELFFSHLQLLTKSLVLFFMLMEETDV